MATKINLFQTHGHDFATWGFTTQPSSIEKYLVRSMFQVPYHSFSSVVRGGILRNSSSMAWGNIARWGGEWGWDVFEDGLKVMTPETLNILYCEQNLISLSVKNLIKFQTSLEVKIWEQNPILIQIFIHTQNLKSKSELIIRINFVLWVLCAQLNWKQIQILIELWLRNQNWDWNLIMIAKKINKFFWIYY